MKIKDVIAKLEKYDGEQPLYFMDRFGAVHEVEEVSLYNSDEEHSAGNEASLITYDGWEQGMSTDTGIIEATRLAFEHFDKVFDGAEYAMIERYRPIKSIRGEARLFFGEAMALDTETAGAILEDIDAYKFPVVKHEETGRRFIGIPGNDFMSIIAMHKEL